MSVPSTTHWRWPDWSQSWKIFPIKFPTDSINRFGPKLRLSVEHFSQQDFELSIRLAFWTRQLASLSGFYIEITHSSTPHPADISSVTGAVFRKKGEVATHQTRWVHWRHPLQCKLQVRNCFVWSGPRVHWSHLPTKSLWTIGILLGGLVCYLVIGLQFWIIIFSNCVLGVHRNAASHL